MVPPLLGLISDGSHRWQVVEAGGYLRVRLYTTTDDFVGLTLMEDGRYQVVECRWRGGDSRRQPGAVSRVVRRGRIAQDGDLNLSGWAVERLVREAEGLNDSKSQDDRM